MEHLPVFQQFKPGKRESPTQPSSCNVSTPSGGHLRAVYFLFKQGQSLHSSERSFHSLFHWYYHALSRVKNPCCSFRSCLSFPCKTEENPDLTNKGSAIASPIGANEESRTKQPKAAPTPACHGHVVRRFVWPEFRKSYDQNGPGNPH